MNRLEPVEAAKQLISRDFPCCQGALLAGSVVRGDATAASDLDIVVFDDSLSSAYTLDQPTQTKIFSSPMHWQMPSMNLCYVRIDNGSAPPNGWYGLCNSMMNCLLRMRTDSLFVHGRYGNQYIVAKLVVMNSQNSFTTDWLG